MDLFLFLAVVIIVAICIHSGPQTYASKSMPQVSRGDYNSHLDFLEMHGCISAEERQAQRDFEEDYAKNPQNYRTVTLEELMKEMEKEKDKS